jgi:hypothetical protein
MASFKHQVPQHGFAFAILLLAVFVTSGYRESTELSALHIKAGLTQEYHTLMDSTYCKGAQVCAPTDNAIAEQFA